MDLKRVTSQVNPKPSLRANGSGECPPDDRLREAIQFFQESLDCFVAEFIIGSAKGRTRWLLAMTAWRLLNLRRQHGAADQPALLQVDQRLVGS